MKKHTKKSMTFTKWMLLLSKIALDQYGFDVSGMDSSWRDFYDDYYSPREALDEDTYAGV